MTRSRARGRDGRRTLLVVLWIVIGLALLAGLVLAVNYLRLRTGIPVH